MKDKFYDEQTGEVFALKPETSADRNVAIISVVYLLLMLAFFLWQLFDIWIRQYTLANLVGYPSLESLNTATFRVFAYTFIGGALGGIINGLRSIIHWHSELGAFGQRYVWKYVTDPWMGATLALIIYTLTRSGMAVIGGEISAESNTAIQVFSMFGLGTIAGYGSRNVFIWLDAQVNQIFKVEKAQDNDFSATVRVPDLIGKQEQEAEETLTETGLKLGEVTEEPQADGTPPEQIGTVIRQDPDPETEVEEEATVDVTLAVNKEQGN